MYQSMGKHQKTSPARFQKTGPLSDRLSQVEMDRVFGSHRLTLLVEGMARPEDHPVKAYPLFLNILTAM